MPDVASPSTSDTFTEQPARSGLSGFAGGAISTVRKYWYVALALALVVGFLIYNYVRSSKAVVGTQGTTADVSAQDQAAQNAAMPASNGNANLPDASSIMDLLSQSYQAMADAIQAGAMSAQQASPSVQPGAAPASVPAPATAVAKGVAAPVMTQPPPRTEPTPPVTQAIPSTPPVFDQTRAAGERLGYLASPAPVPAIALSAPAPAPTLLERIFQKVAAPPPPTPPPGMSTYYQPATTGVAAPPPDNSRRLARGMLAGGAPLAGGPPPSGPAVPFGTHVALHDALRSSGTMYASSRNVGNS